MFLKPIREFLKFRYVAKTKAEAMSIINSARGTMDLFYSIYSYKKLDEFKRPIRRTARLTWIMFDLDVKEGWNINTFAEIKDDIRYKWFLLNSGTGAHLYIFTDYLDSCVYEYPHDVIGNFQREFMEKYPNLGYDSARTCIGNLSMLGRLPFGFNWKYGREVLPYNPYTLKLSRKIICHPGELVPLHSYDKRVDFGTVLYQNYTVMRSNPDFDMDEFSKIVKLPYLPPCIELMISNKMGFAERQYLAAALRDAGFTFERAMAVFKQLLGNTKHDEGGTYLTHFLREGILKWVYSLENPFEVRCIDLARKGFCCSCPKDERNMYRKKIEIHLKEEETSG